MGGFLLSRGQFFGKNFNLTLRGIFVHFLGELVLRWGGGVYFLRVAETAWLEWVGKNW
jgi:hypothetical protein